MATNALRTINRIAKTLKKEHPAMKHSSAIKQASAIYRRDHGGARTKKKPAKKHRVGAARSKPSVGTDRVDNKKVSVTIGGMTVAKARKYLKDEAEEKLGWALLHRDRSKTATDRKYYEKKVTEFRKKLKHAELL